MTRYWTRVLSLTAALALVTAAVAQPPGGPPRGEAPRRGGGPPDGPRGFGGGPGRQLPPLPVLEALDADHDGEISSGEIANAVAALKALDKNEDGKLTRQELMPDPAEMRRRGFGRPGEGPGGRPRGRGDGPPEASVIVERMMRLDKDGDEKLSKEELPEKMKNMLSRLDTNDDGVVDRAEVEQTVRQRQERWRGRDGAARRPRRGDENRDASPRRERPATDEADDN